MIKKIHSLDFMLDTINGKGMRWKLSTISQPMFPTSYKDNGTETTCTKTSKKTASEKGGILETGYLLKKHSILYFSIIYSERIKKLFSIIFKKSTIHCQHHSCGFSNISTHLIFSFLNNLH